MTKVIRDAQGDTINIGDWDYKYKQDKNEKGKPKLDELGKPVVIAMNPLPEGATTSDEVVDDMSDGSRVVATDYATKRRIEYPAIADQLDDIYHNGLDGWKSKIKAIKDKHPKS